MQAADGSWRTVPTEAFMDTDRPAELPPREEEEMSGTNVPPPAAIPPPSTVGEPTDAELNALQEQARVRGRVCVPGLAEGAAASTSCCRCWWCWPWPAAIVAAKALRRRRRRSAEPVSARFGGGWREITDHARDLGLAITGATRREESLALAGIGAAGRAPALARDADRHVFGPRPPQAEAATAYWEDVDAYRAALSSQVTRGRRIRAALSLRTFRPGR